MYLCSWTNTLEKHTGSRKTCYREVNIVVTVQCYILTVLMPVFNTPIHLPNKPALWWENQTTGCPRWKPNCFSLRINNDPSTSPLLSKYYLLPRVCIYFWEKLKSSCTLILLFVIGDTSCTWRLSITGGPTQIMENKTSSHQFLMFKIILVTKTCKSTEIIKE